MNGHFRRWTALVALGMTIFFAATVGMLYGEDFTDPGFENYLLSSGGFVQPTSGPWLFSNDAGVVEPFAPNSSTGPLHTWSATFPAAQGQQYASTYAGIDRLRQAVSFAAAGDYRISVYAAAPSGSLTIPSVGTWPLEDGEFTFILGAADIGSLHTVPKGSSWNSYSAMFTIPSPGNYTLGVRNTQTTPYFINYDGFAIQSVPEPATAALLVAGAIGLAAGWHALTTRKRRVSMESRAMPTRG